MVGPFMRSDCEIPVTEITRSANATGAFSSYNSAGAFESGSETWLRGGWYTDANGIVELTTIFPGYYTGRAPHIHLMVHKGWTESDNGFVHAVSSDLSGVD